MSHDELRRMFDTVLTAPPPDTSDIDATIRAGRRRRRRRTTAVVLSAAAAVAAIGIATTAVLPSPHRQPAPAASVGVTAHDGILVTDARQLLGSWHTIQLDGQDVSALRDTRDVPLTVNFSQDGAHLSWGANDNVNYSSGPLSVSKQGAFQAQSGFMTAMGGPPGAPQFKRNPEAVDQATEARLVAATLTGPPKLLLLTDGKLVAVYTPVT